MRTYPGGGFQEQERAFSMQAVHAVATGAPGEYPSAIQRTSENTESDFLTKGNYLKHTSKQENVSKTPFNTVSGTAKKGTAGRVPDLLTCAN